MTTRTEQLAAFDRLLTIMDELRAQCPWDKKQTMETLRPLTIEETNELADAILDQNLWEVNGELGDLLLHIVFYAKIGSEQGHFDMTTVWIDRQNLDNGGNWGATKVVDNLPKPDVIFKDLISFAEETAKN